MGRIKLTSFFTGVRRKVTDEVLVNESQNIVVLLAVCGDVFNQLNQLSDCLGLIAGAFAKFAQAGFQRVKYLAEYLFLRFTDQTIKCRERCSDIIHRKSAPHFQPSGKKIPIIDEIAKMHLTVNYQLLITLVYVFLNICIFIAVLLKKCNFLVRKKFIENKS